MGAERKLTGGGRRAPMEVTDAVDGFLLRDAVDDLRAPAERTPDTLGVSAGIAFVEGPTPLNTT